MPPQSLEVENDEEKQFRKALDSSSNSASFRRQNDEDDPIVSVRDEWADQLKTAWPTLLGSLLRKGPWLISLRFVGGIGGDELAAAALASTLCNVTGLSLSVGLSSALTTLAGQARGHLLRKRQLEEGTEVQAWEKQQQFFGEGSAVELESLESAKSEPAPLLSRGESSFSETPSSKPIMPLVFLYRGMFIQIVFVIPVGIWWLYGIEPVLIRLGQGAMLSSMTQDYLRILAPNLWAYSINWTLTSWLQSMEMADIPAYANALGLITHVPLNYFFIYGLGWGYLGSAIATVAYQALQPICLVIYLMTRRGRMRLWHQMGASRSISHAPFWPTLWLAVSKGIGQYLGLALPGIIIISEWWASEAACFLSGLFDNPAVTLGAMTLYQSINTFCFQLPMGFSVAGGARVSTWLGAGQAGSAARASAVSVASAACFSALMGVVLYVTPHTFFPSLFAPDEVDLYTQAGELMPLLAFYVFADGVQTTLNGTIKGCGLQAYVMPVVVVAYWVVGLPLGYYLAFDEECSTFCGDFGLVAGMTTGTWVHMIMLALLVVCGIDWKRESGKAHSRMLACEEEEDTEGVSDSDSAALELQTRPKL
eukprot:scaffold4097_cov166-Amphora_coffeaeformis.AAC.55